MMEKFYFLIHCLVVKSTTMHHITKIIIFHVFIIN